MLDVDIYDQLSAQLSHSIYSYIYFIQQYNSMHNYLILLQIQSFIQKFEFGAIESLQFRKRVQFFEFLFEKYYKTFDNEQYKLTIDKFTLNGWLSKTLEKALKGKRAKSFDGKRKTKKINWKSALIYERSCCWCYCTFFSYSFALTLLWLFKRLHVCLTNVIILWGM